MNNERKKIANYYTAGLSHLENLDFLTPTPDSQSNNHIFGILVDPSEKNWIMNALRAEGVMANVHYAPLHRNKLYANLATDKEMKDSLKFYDRYLRLPIYPSLTNNEIEQVVASVIKVLMSM